MKYDSIAATFEEVKKKAHDKARKPYKEDKKRPPAPLVPIFVAIDRDSTLDIRENFLYRLGDSEVTPAAAAKSLCSELQLQQGPPTNHDWYFEEQIRQGLRNFASWRPLEDEVVVPLTVCVRVGDYVVLDAVEWDIAAPHNTAEMYAATLCGEFGLPFVWCKAIAEHVRGQLDACKQEAERRGVSAVGLPPIPEKRSWKIEHTPSGEGVRMFMGAPVPRVERYDMEKHDQLLRAKPTWLGARDTDVVMHDM